MVTADGELLELSSEEDVELELLSSSEEEVESSDELVEFSDELVEFSDELV